ncbi:HepT-like ribonuclease domain-containing protein [Spirosoma validum]|nr:HepT-like ribonuclease domain-containing protein [Spirosoma validum]
MLECAEKIFIYAHNYLDAEELAWDADQRDFNAIWALLLVIGEESKKIESDLKKEFQQIPWPNIAGMRNYLAHDYSGIDHERVWEVIKATLPDLKDVLITMIDRITYPQESLIRALDSPYYQHIQHLRDKLIK